MAVSTNFTAGANASASGPVDWSKYSASVILETHRGSAVYTCSGVLLAPDLVLTAAHCVQGVDSLRASNDLSYDPDDGNWARAVDYRVHPLYRPEHSLYGYDLAVVRLRPNAIPNANYASIRREDEHFPEGVKLKRVGFGGRGNENRRTLTDPTFEEWTTVDGKPVAGKTIDSHAVVGDSGGPVFYEDPVTGKLTLVGVHSTYWGETGEAFFPRLSRFRDWIARYGR